MQEGPAASVGRLDMMITFYFLISLLTFIMVKSLFCSSFTLTTFSARKQMLQRIEAIRDVTNRTFRYLGSNLFSKGTLSLAFR